ncbi:MAG: PhoU domain-containing protein [Candidatus Omnitrophota bacterium]
MPDLNAIKTKAAEMSAVCLEMWQTAFKCFMEHDLDLLSKALEYEVKLNNLEKEITSDLIELSRYCIEKEEKSKALIYADAAGDLELIGDYCKDILERVQIKIEEKLLFSDEAVEEYKELYDKTENALREIVTALERDDLSLIKEVLKDEEHIDSLVDEYRKKHNQRVIEGVCKPFACNMFINMLDFTAVVYYHAKKIARSLLNINKIK